MLSRHHILIHGRGHYILTLGRWRDVIRHTCVQLRGETHRSGRIAHLGRILTHRSKLANLGHLAHLSTFMREEALMSCRHCWLWCHEHLWTLCSLTHHKLLESCLLHLLLHGLLLLLLLQELFLLASLPVKPLLLHTSSGRLVKHSGCSQVSSESLLLLLQFEEILRRQDWLSEECSSSSVRG